MINSDNSIQINIKFTFTVYEYIIVYEYILLSNLIYIIYQYNIYIYIYIYIYICKIYLYKLCVFRLLQHCLNTSTRWSHWFHISSWFYLISVTSRNSPRTWSKLLRKKPTQLSKSLFCYSWWSSDRFQT